MKAPYIPLYVKDWLCSRRVLSMSGDAVKAYLYLMCEAWRDEPRATLPDNDAEIFLLSRADTDTWNRVRAEVMQHWKPGTCEEHKGRLYNDLLLESSRSFESKRRFGNKNAEKTQTERKINAEETQKNHKQNARLAIANAIGIGIDSGSDSSEESPAPPHPTLLFHAPGYRELREAYPPNGSDIDPAAVFALRRALADGTKLADILAGAKAFAAIAKPGSMYYRKRLVTWLDEKQWAMDWAQIAKPIIAPAKSNEPQGFQPRGHGLYVEDKTPDDEIASPEEVGALIENTIAAIKGKTTRTQRGNE